MKKKSKKPAKAKKVVKAKKSSTPKKTSTPQKAKHSGPAPKGYGTVSPYLTVNSVEKLLRFVRIVFKADIIEKLQQPDGAIIHAEARIGDSVVMMGRGINEFPATESRLYVYTNNVDKIYKTALQQGAISLMEPEDQVYGNREAGFRDPLGNQWWVAKHNENVSEKEIKRRLAEFRKK